MKQPDGKRALYESWVREYAGNLYRCALRLCGQADVAEELVQEVFYEAWRAIDSLRDPAKARVWLLGILRHRYMHWVRDQKRHPRSGPRIQSRAEAVSSGEDTPQDVLARRESLQRALDALDDRYKVPFLLVFLEGLTCQETASFLEMPLGTVLSRIHRARQFLREHMTRENVKGAKQSPKPMRIHREELNRNERRAGDGSAGGAT
jgi:RNA polymerase sigma-70 factor (ECF subfamily)